jgi:hypothetical protein
MTTVANQHLLIVQSIAADPAGREELIARLAREHGLDGYLCRQCLVGRGPNLLARGARNELDPIARLLADSGLACWLVEPGEPRLKPVRMRGLQIAPQSICFLTAGEPLTLERGETVAAVLADLSGAVIGKNLKQMVAQKIYHGVEQARPIGDDELHQAILRAEPVLDLYLFDSDYQVRAQLRVMPGRFDPKGLAERMSLSATGNLAQVLNLVREYAGRFSLSLDFGLASLPGCRVERAGDTPHWRQNNLAGLTRFGWLLSDLQAAGQFPATAAVLAEGEATRLAAATGLGDLDYLGEVLGEFHDQVPLPAPEPEQTVALPPPPPRPRSAGRPRFQLLSVLSGVAGFGAWLLVENHTLWQLLVRYGIRPGLVPAALAAGCLWGGFYFLRLRRRVENTPTSKTRSVAMGLAEVQGRARRKYALVSPEGQAPCVYYRLRRYRRDSKNRWRLAGSSDSSHVPFYLEDETGRLLIAPDGANIRAKTRHEGFGGQANLLFDRASHIDRDEKWIEETIPEGNLLYVLGQAMENGQRRPPLRQRVIEALRQLKRDPGTLRRYDTDGDGTLSAAEWQQARQQVEEELLARSLSDQGASRPPWDQVVIARPGQRSLPFIIAETPSEAHLARGYALFTVLLFGGALLAVVWTAVMLVEYLQLG